MMRVLYSDYLKSPYWKAIRKEMLFYYDKCERCGDTEDLQVHHTNYERLGHEWVPEDLEVLCRYCHCIEHDLPTPDPYARG